MSDKSTTIAAENPLTESATSPVGRRRIPQQERGHKTIEIILKAAGQEIERAGLTKLTTKRIAEAAGMSVGGLYEYFPNKEAVVHAMASQWLQQVKATIGAVHPAKTGCVDLIRYLEMVYDTVRPLYQQEPGIGVLINVLASVPELKELEDEIDAQVNDLLADAISYLLPYVAREQCSTMARTLTILDHYLLIESIVSDPVHAALYDTHHRVCRFALATNLMQMNALARAAARTPPRSDPQPDSVDAPRPEAPPDVI
jgi:AcrR family transcriptional regulator